MDKYKQQYSNELLDKYMSGRMTVDELKMLKQSVNIHTDEELETDLYTKWQGFSDVRPIPFAVQQKMFATIIQRTRSDSATIWNKRGLRIAVSFIVIMLTSFSIYLYNSNREIVKLSNQNVVVKTNKNERVSVTLPDGTSVRLNSESELSYQQNFGLKDRVVSLNGEGYFDVKRNESRQFIVKTQFLDIKVLGTAFNIYAYQNTDSTEMTLIRGNVEVTSTYPPYQTMTVRPGEKVICDKRTGKMRLENSSNQIETAWLKHELVFRSTNLKDVFDRLERKYGFNIEIKDTQLLKDKYTGVFDEVEINDVMQILRTHFGFTYRIRENTIWIESTKHQ